MTHVSLQPIGASAIRSCILFFLTLPISMVLVALTFCLSSFIWERAYHLILPYDIVIFLFCSCGHSLGLSSFLYIGMPEASNRVLTDSRGLL